MQSLDYFIWNGTRGFSLGHNDGCPSFYEKKTYCIQRYNPIVIIRINSSKFPKVCNVYQDDGFLSETI